MLKSRKEVGDSGRGGVVEVRRKKGRERCCCVEKADGITDFQFLLVNLARRINGVLVGPAVPYPCSLPSYLQ